jgi:cytochrome c
MDGRMNMRVGLAIVAILAVMAQPVPAAAQDERARRAGAALEQDLCSQCHIVSEAQRGPVLDGVPSFPALARSDRTDAQLRAWLTDPHPPMPRVTLSESEISDVIAYMRSFSD